MWLMYLVFSRFLDLARAKSKIFRDQPESPLERAVFWTEYVVRHGGAPHLRSAATRLAWYQLHLLDVAAVLLVTLLLLVLLLRAALRIALRACCGDTKKDKPKPNLKHGDKKTK